MDLLSELDTTGLASGNALDLKQAYSQRNRNLLRNYADILYARILGDVMYRKDFLLDKLTNNVSTPNAPMRVKIWDYSVTHPSVFELPRDTNAMVDFSNRGHHTVVFDDGRPMSVDTIFRKTDLAWRLAFTFGSKFYVTYLREDMKAFSQDYSSYRIGVYLYYYPQGLPSYHEKRLITAYTEARDRKLYAGTNVSMTARF